MPLSLSHGWQKDWKAKEKSIERATEIPYLLSNMKKYLNKLFIKAKGSTYYPQIIVELMEPPTEIVESGYSIWSKACGKCHSSLPKTLHA